MSPGEHSGAVSSTEEELMGTQTELKVELCQHIPQNNFVRLLLNDDIFQHWYCFKLIKIMCLFFFSQPEGTHISDNGQLGPGVSHPGPRASPQDVQSTEKAVWQHRGAAAGHEEDLHHQCCLGPGHHQPPGITRSDQVSAVRSYGERGREANDRWTWVGCGCLRGSVLVLNMFE